VVPGYVADWTVAVIGVVGVLVPHALGGPQAEDRQNGQQREGTMQTKTTPHDDNGTVYHACGQAPARESASIRPRAIHEACVTVRMSAWRRP
jgi:hypothetical protein